MQPVIGPCNVKVFGGWEIDGVTKRLAKITTLGDTAKLYEWTPIPGRPDAMNFVEYDKLTGCEFMEDPEKDSFVVTGLSEKMRDIIGLNPSDTNVRWEVDVLRCTNCT